MSSNAQRSKAAAVATLRSSLLVDNISKDISNLSLNGSQAREQPGFWFIPAYLPIPPRQKGKKHTKPKPGGHIPRPRNAYVLLRSQLFAKGVLPASIKFCRRNVQVSRIASRIWGALSDYDKERFYDLGEQEKHLHKEQYPEYKITGRNTKAKDQEDNCPTDESSMTSDEITCKRIADIILQNIQGEALTTQIRDAVKAAPNSGLFDPESINSLSRKKRTKKGDMEFEKTTPQARPAQRSKKVRANKPRAAPKIRSSFSKKKQSKSSMKPPRALMFNPSRRETSFSDYCWDEGSTLDHDTSYTSSKVGLPPASVSSAHTNLYTPSRALSPPAVGDVAGQIFGWDMDVNVRKTPFDQESSFEAYKDAWDSFSEDTIFATMRAMDQSAYHAEHDRQSEGTQMAMAESRFTDNDNLVATPEPQTISLEWFV